MNRYDWIHIQIYRYLFHPVPLIWNIYTRLTCEDKMAKAPQVFRLPSHDGGSMTSTHEPTPQVPGHPGGGGMMPRQSKWFDLSQPNGAGGPTFSIHVHVSYKNGLQKDTKNNLHSTSFQIFGSYWTISCLQKADVYPTCFQIVGSTSSHVEPTKSCSFKNHVPYKNSLVYIAYKKNGLDPFCSTKKPSTKLL